MYKYYHKLTVRVTKKLLNDSKKNKNLAVNLVSGSLVAAGTIAGAVTLNPIILEDSDNRSWTFA